MTTNGEPVRRFQGYDELTVYAAYPENPNNVADYRITLPHLSLEAVPMPAGGGKLIFSLCLLYRRFNVSMRN